MSGCWSLPLACPHQELFPGLGNEIENRPNNVTVFCCYFFFHEQNVQHYFLSLCAMLQVRNNLIGTLAYAVYKLQSPASCAEGTFPGTQWRGGGGGRRWRVVGYSPSWVLIRLGSKCPHARGCSFLGLVFSWKLWDAFCLRVIKLQPRAWALGRD